MTDSVRNPAPADLATVTITTDSGKVTTPCEPINDYLAITPAFGMDTDGKTWLLGGFTITHRVTGTSIAEGMGCVECCRWAGKEMAALEADWSTLTSDNGKGWFAAIPEAAQRRFMEVRAVEWMCDAETCDHKGNQD